MMNFAFKIMNFPGSGNLFVTFVDEMAALDFRMVKLMNFVLKLMSFVFKMMSYVLKIMNSV